MSEFLNRTAGKAKTCESVVSPVKKQELANWLAVDESEPNLDSLLVQATSIVIHHIGLDLLPRDWTVIYWDWPVNGTMTSPSLSRQDGYYRREIKLPYANLIEVSQVKAFGQEITDFVVRENSIIFSPIISDYNGSNEFPALEVEYTAGYFDVPEDIKSAIKMLAAFLFEHRGECDASDALSKSGARQILIPYRDESVMV